MMADGDGKPQVHKSCRALALSLVKCLDESACMQGEKRSYKDCALDENMAASPACRDIRDTYMKCKHEQVGLVVRERIFNNPELLRVV
ncbi:hypothetical protein KC19_12G098900 [Ceratodon purpureus]|uniref:Cytochrome c oxidase assembly factor 5 n=1 Tax=Ceratodon purpureus TaxID=3225 RepID=A0A8T0G660_CERPU|nr:hypothetical protein KC19_12G098900 [Ceratodon purpureus]